MNSKITENTIKRLQSAHERRMQRIIKTEQEGRESCFNRDFKLIGILNMFDIIPDFVIPIFTCLQDNPEEPNVMNKTFYFQVGDDEKDKLNYFEKLENYGENLRERVEILKGYNIYSGVTYNIYSKPLYAFQYSEASWTSGNYSEMKEFLEKYETEDEILKEEIQDFLNLESKNIWVRVKEQLEKNFPDDSVNEIAIKMRTLKNNEFKGEKLELYVPKFKDTVLRVGVQVKGEKKKAYFTTTEGEKLEDLLND